MVERDSLYDFIPVKFLNQGGPGSLTHQSRCDLIVVIVIAQYMYMADVQTYRTMRRD